MPAGSRTPQAGETRKALLFASRDPEFCEPARKLRTGAQAELAVRMGQRLLDRVHAHEQLGRDLAIRPPLRDELGDATLARGHLAPLFATARLAPAPPRVGHCTPRRACEPPRAPLAPRAFASPADESARG